MLFKTKQKDYEIEFSHVGHGKSTPVFILKVTRPFEIKERFSIDKLSYDERNGEKIEGIRFYEFTELAKKVSSNGRSVLFSLTPEALEFVRNTADEIINNLKEEAQNQTVEKWYWAIGGDTHNLYVTADIDTEFRPDVKEISGVVENTCGRGNIIDMLMDKSIQSDMSTALYTPNGWFEISNDDLMDIYDMIVAEKDEIGKIKKEKREKKEAERRVIIEKAIATGEKQVLFRTIDECNDPREECDIDEIVEYAMPDGTTKTERYHTW